MTFNVVTRSAKSATTPESLTDRQERIAGWRQDRMRAGRALVLGAGALGNEVVKNLVLMGLGYILLADFDRVEPSNLSRAALLRRSDARQRRSKAEAVAARARTLSVNPDVVIKPFLQDIVWDLGTGVYRRVDVVIGCLDNIEARLAANRAAWLTGTPFVDGAISGLTGSIFNLHPPETACWECTLPPEMLNLRVERYDSCWQVMNREFQAGRIATVQVASAIVAGFQAQEAAKIVQGQRWGAGTKTFYSATGGRPVLDNVTVARRDDCWCHGATPPGAPLELPLTIEGHTLGDLQRALAERGFPQAQIYFPAPFVLERHCVQCQSRATLLAPTFRLDTAALVCSQCGAGGDWVQLVTVSHNQTAGAANLSGLSLASLGYAPLGWVEFLPNTGGSQPAYAELSAQADEVMGGAAWGAVHAGEG